MATLVQYKHYTNSREANRDKQILKNNGLESFIANEQTIQSDWLLSQALGGIQLQVFDDEKEKAIEIINNFLENEHTSLEVEHTILNPEFDFTCPKCGSNHLYRDENPGGLFGVSLLVLGFPLKAPSHLYHCYYCNNEFQA